MPRYHTVQSQQRTNNLELLWDRYREYEVMRKMVSISYGRRACHIPETIKDIWLQKTWLRANKLVVIPVYEVDLSTASVCSATAERSQNFHKDAICHFLLALVNLAPFCSFI